MRIGFLLGFEDIGNMERLDGWDGSSLEAGFDIP